MYICIHINIYILYPSSMHQPPHRQRCEVPHPRTECRWMGQVWLRGGRWIPHFKTPLWITDEIWDIQPRIGHFFGVCEFVQTMGGYMDVKIMINLLIVFVFPWANPLILVNGSHISWDDLDSGCKPEWCGLSIWFKSLLRWQNTEGFWYTDSHII